MPPCVSIIFWQNQLLAWLAYFQFLVHVAWKLVSGKLVNCVYLAKTNKKGWWGRGRHAPPLQRRCEGPSSPLAALIRARARTLRGPIVLALFFIIIIIIFCLLPPSGPFLRGFPCVTLKDTWQRGSVGRTEGLQESSAPKSAQGLCSAP